MTTSPPRTSDLSPAPEWLRDLAAARAHFEERFGWPVALQVAERRLVIAIGQSIDAISMPAELAARVHAQLGIAMLAGPVIAHPEDRWTFLVQTGSRMPAESLAEHDVRHPAPGTYIAIPSAGVGLRWITEPRPNQMLPSAYAVIATARRVCAAP